LLRVTHDINISRVQTFVAVSRRLRFQLIYKKTRESD